LCLNFVNFRFTLFTPPLGDFQIATLVHWDATTWK
jgi:hypothetical protein